MPLREQIEKYQVLFYLLALLAGLGLGLHRPDVADVVEGLLWPLLAVLLFSTFTQVPLVRLRRALVDSRFLTAAVLGNFVAIPLIVWLMVQWLPADPALRLGVLLVLLVPCTDWFLTFTHLGGGDAPRALAFTPLSLLLQLLLLPLYLWLFLGHTAMAGLVQRELLLAFGGLILLPLTGAWALEHWSAERTARKRWVAGLGWLPIPLLGLVLFTVAAGQVGQVTGSLALLPRLALLFVAFLLAALLLARLLATAFRLPPAQGRVLAFSFGSRNSFVILPLALALPAGFEVAVVVVVFQSLVELFGMLAFLRLVPTHLFPTIKST
ncbi:arsenic resistance protein [Billgrantia montanilacus]|uniref:arsenic resistance protein n=1 Tax=Billgrantia montanilacus TaxID=2282305 RepID=UPI002680D8E9